MGWNAFESFRPGYPDFADVFVWGEAVECLQPARKIVCRRNATMIASSSLLNIVEHGTVGPVLRSSTVARLCHLRTVFGLSRKSLPQGKCQTTVIRDIPTTMAGPSPEPVSPGDGPGPAPYGNKPQDVFQRAQLSGQFIGDSGRLPEPLAPGLCGLPRANSTRPPAPGSQDRSAGQPNPVSEYAPDGRAGHRTRQVRTDPSSSAQNCQAACDPPTLSERRRTPEKTEQ